MKVNKIENPEVFELFQTEVNEDKITINLKNGSTLLLIPKVEEGIVIGYEADYLTGKENKSISKLELKIKKLQDEIQGIKQNGGGEGEAETDPIDEENVENLDEKKEIVEGE